MDVDELQGISEHDCLNGALYLRIHYSADEEKDAAWVALNKPGTPINEWKREMEMDEDIYDGDPVFPDFSKERHAYRIDGREAPIPTKQSVVGRCRYVGSWDCGQTVHPAFALWQVMEIGQAHVIAELTTEEDYMSTFAPKVLTLCSRLLPGCWDEIKHVGDPTVKQRSGTDGKSAQSEARKHGINIKAMTNVWAVRASAVEKLLTSKTKSGAERFMIDATRCPVLYEGFKGAYHTENSARGDTVGPGRVILMPVKNGYSHIQDAVQYGAIEVLKILKELGHELS